MYNDWDKKQERHRIVKYKKHLRRKKRKGNGRTIFRNQGGIDEILSLNIFNYLSNCKEYSASISMYPKEKLEIVIPKIFSISKNPEESLRFLRETFYRCRDEKVKKLNVDFSRCEELGLDASTVFDSILSAVFAERRRKNKELEMEGPYVEINRNIRGLLRTSGIFSHFKIYLPPVEQDDKMLEKFTPFDLQRGHHNSNQSDVMATKLTEYFDKCLKLQGYKLTRKGHHKFCQMLGEVVNNCEMHAGEISVWHAIGNYCVSEDKDVGELQLVLFDIGATMYEGLFANDSSEETKEKFQKMVKIHKNKFNNDWDEEALASVFVLQSTVSRKRDSNIEHEMDRGTGTIRLIESFKSIGCTTDGNTPKMTITSGRTHIDFLHNYSLRKQNFNDMIFGNGDQKVIAFNQKNNIYDRPDNKAVRKISEFFPGTIISMNFYLDREYISRNIS